MTAIALAGASSCHPARPRPGNDAPAVQTAGVMYGLHFARFELPLPHFATDPRRLMEDGAQASGADRA